MDDFKLKSLDDFDRDFIAQTKAPKAAAPAHKKESLIPKMEKPVDEEPIEIDFFGLTGDIAAEENVQQEAPAPSEPIQQDIPAAAPAVSAVRRKRSLHGLCHNKRPFGGTWLSKGLFKYA